MSSVVSESRKVCLPVFTVRAGAKAVRMLSGQAVYLRSDTLMAMSTFESVHSAGELDNTHHNAYGAYELARCVVEGIKINVPELAAHLAKDIGTFDPAKQSSQLHPKNFVGCC